MLDLVGVWRLVGASYVVLEGTSERTELLGSEPRAYAIFEPGGRMMVIGQANDRTPGTSTAAMAALFRSMVAYSGKWSIDGEKFVTVVDVAADPSWVGTVQVRYFTFDGQTLSLRTAPLELPSFPGRRAVVYADWEKEG
jgi:Lipocalin-like domain